jgi:hypothetical protein
MTEALQNELPLQRRHAFKGARHREFIGSLGNAIHLGIVDRHRGLLFEPLPLPTMRCEVGEREAARAYFEPFFVISLGLTERATTAPSRHALAGPVRRKSRGRFGAGRSPRGGAGYFKKCPAAFARGAKGAQGLGGFIAHGADDALQWRQFRDIVPAEKRHGSLPTMIRANSIGNRDDDRVGIVSWRRLRLNRRHIAKNRNRLNH